MGKRFRNKSGNKSQASKGVDIGNGKRFERNAIETWDDVEHDEIDKFHESRDKIAFDNNDNDSDQLEDQEEVLGIDFEEEEEEDDEEENDEEEEEVEDWGKGRNVYYDGDELEDEEDEKLEEEEAMRIQKMRTNAMDEEDFVDPIHGSLTGKALVKDDLEDHKLVLDLDNELKNVALLAPITKVSKDKKYTKEEAIEAIETESPEFFGLLEQLEEKWEAVKDEMTLVAKRIKSLNPETVKATPLLQHFYLKYETTINYITNIAFYLHLKSIGTPNLQDHPIIDVLLKHANIISSLEEAEEGSEDLIDMVKDALSVIENGGTINNEEDENVNEDLSLDESDHIEESEEESAETEEEIEEIEIEPESSDIEELSEQTLAQLKKSLKATTSNKLTKDSDFQDTEYLDEGDAAEKMVKKKSLRHYASVINQVNQKRSRAPKFSGDTDLPYKAPEKRNKVPVNQALNNQFNDADNFDDDEEVALVKDELNEKKRKNKKVKSLEPEEMARRTEAWKAMNPDEQEVEGNSKRLASYKILKNKGLTPKRKKEQRNPRVKHRKKFEKASKKLSSFKRVVQDTKSSYGGEATGIKTHLSRSVRFQ